MMKALVYRGPGVIEWAEVALPEMHDSRDAIGRVAAVTSCGTDLHILKGDLPEVESGRILGHEAVGTVLEVGAAVTGISEGSRVLISCISGCGRCRVLPYRRLWSVPRCRWMGPRASDRRHPGRVRPRSQLAPLPPPIVRQRTMRSRQGRGAPTSIAKSAIEPTRTGRRSSRIVAAVSNGPPMASPSA